MTTAHHTPTDDTRSIEATNEFVLRFKDFGAEPTPEKYDNLFHAEGTVLDAGMDTPTPKSQLPAAITTFLRNVPDLHIGVRSYYTRKNTVYMLTDNVGTYQGVHVNYPAIYACRLHDSLVIEGRRYYDQARLLAPIIRDIPPLPVYEPTWTADLHGTTHTGKTAPVDPAQFVNHYDAIWHGNRADIPRRLANYYTKHGTILNPGMIRPIVKAEIPGYYHWLFNVSPDLGNHLQGWAGDTESVAVEWTYSAHTWAGRGPLTRLLVTDVFEFDDDGGVRFGHAYFDSLTMIAASDPTIARQIASAREKFFG